MIKAEHIMHLKLDRVRLLEHKQMTPPPYAMKELSNQIAAIGDAVISKILNIPTSVFRAKLEEARRHRVSYLIEDSNRVLSGISTALSVIKQGNILQKSLVIPKYSLKRNTGLNNHYIIGAFVRSPIVNGTLPDVSDVEVAGWADLYDIEQFKISDLPATFQSKLQVTMVPCSMLRPISTLASQFNNATRFV